MCACTEPVRTGIGAVCVEYGRSKWSITMLNHTNKQTNKHLWYRKMFCFLFLAPYACTTRYEEAFLPEGKKTASLASLSRPCLTTKSLSADMVCAPIPTVPPLLFIVVQVGMIPSYLYMYIPPAASRWLHALPTQQPFSDTYQIIFYTHF